MTQNDLMRKAEWEAECKDAQATTQMLGMVIIFLAVVCVAGVLAFVLRHQAEIHYAIAWVQLHLDATFGGAFALVGFGMFHQSLFGKIDLGSRVLAAGLGFLLVATGGNMLVSALIN